MDIIISDIDMPVADGEHLCKNIRRREKEVGLKRCPIILISGNDNLKRVEELLRKDGEYQADLFLKKPIDFDEIMQAVAELVAI